MAQKVKLSAEREPSGALYREIYWLVGDQLGTPRIIAERTGSLTGIKRHDYLPFGEVIGTGVGGRSESQGYVAESVRQGFTAYERDDETGLDYAQARYFSSGQRRFTSPDSLYLELKRLPDPQQLTLYQYARNNPLKFVDPLGMDIGVYPATGSDGKTNWQSQQEYIDYLQKKLPSFTISVNKDSNKIQIVNGKGEALDDKALGALGKTLKGGEKELFTAITDKDHHATINLVDGDPTVAFGRFNGTGVNTVDLSDLRAVSNPNNVAGGITAEEIAAHEAL